MAKRTSIGETRNGESETSGSEAAREIVPRVSIPLNKDGRIDWERVRPSSRDRLLALLRNDPQLAAPSAAGSAAAPDVFNDAWCSMVFDALGQLEIAIAMRVYHCTHAQASVLLYTDADKKMLTGPTARVLNKYAGAMFLKYGDEAALAMLIVSATLPKVTVLRSTLSMSHPKADVIFGRGNVPITDRTDRATRPPSRVEHFESGRARPAASTPIEADAKPPAQPPPGPALSDTASDR